MCDNGGNLESLYRLTVCLLRTSRGYTTKTRPPLGIPELIVSPSGNLAIGNNGTGTTVNYDVWGVPSSFDFGSIYKGDTKKASFLLENGEASGSFTESGASSGDAYSLYVERTDLSTSDTVSFSGFIGTIAFHHGTFTSSDYSSAYSTVGDAATAGFVYSDTDTTISYTWGTLNSVDTSTSGQTGYTWTPTSAITADVLMVAGGGGGGGHMGGGGGAGGLLFNENVSLSGQKNIVVGNGGTGGVLYGVGTNGTDTTFTDLSTVVGGGRGGSYVSPVLASGFSGANGGSGGGSGHNNTSGVVVGQGDDGPPKQGYDGGQSTTNSDGGGGGGAGGVGGNGSGVDGGAGGIGSDQSSNFTTVYGDSGYFASGGGGGSRSATAGTASDGGGSNGTYGNNSALAAQKHTGGGGGGGGGTTTTGFGGGDGGSGIVLIKSSGTGKKIPKVTGASFDSTNVTFTVQDASNITNIKYTINGGSEQTTPVGTLSVAHSLSSSASITVVAWAVDTNGNQLSAKKTVTGTIPSQPTLVNTISLTGGDWSTQNPVGQYDYINTNTNSTYYEYELSIASGNSNYYIAYNWTTKKWFDTNTGTTDNTFGTSATDTGTTSRETSENPSVVYVFSSQLEAQFNNPYYQT